MNHPSTLPELQARYGERYRWLLLVAVMVGSMASIMSSTIVNVAVPDMSRHFAIGQERAQWVASGFMVAMTVSMLTTPWLLGRFGYRRTYSGSMWVLLAGGVLGGLSDHYSLVLIARVAEGLAAGVVQPIPAIIVMRAFQPHEQGRAMSVFGLGAVLAPALGPTLGGVLVDLFGWRSIFFMVVPFCLASLWMSARFVPASAPGGVAANQNGSPLDWPSLLLAIAGTLCLLNGLVQLHSGPTWPAFLLLAGAAGLMVWFVGRQRRLGAASATGQGNAPLMNQAVFADHRFAMGSIVAFIYGMALFGSTYLLPVYMQLGLSFALVGIVRIHTSLWVITTLVVLGRIGLGFILPSLNLGAMRGLHKELIPQGASAINFARTLGGATGVSLCGIVLEWRLAAHGDSLAKVTSSAARLAAFNESFLMLAGLCLLALLAARHLRDPVPAA